MAYSKIHIRLIGTSFNAIQHSRYCENAQYILGFYNDFQRIVIDEIYYVINTKHICYLASLSRMILMFLYSTI